MYTALSLCDLSNVLANLAYKNKTKNNTLLFSYKLCVSMSLCIISIILNHLKTQASVHVCMCVYNCRKLAVFCN